MERAASREGVSVVLPRAQVVGGKDTDPACPAHHLTVMSGLHPRQVWGTWESCAFLGDWLASEGGDPGAPCW